MPPRATGLTALKHRAHVRHSYPYNVDTTEAIGLLGGTLRVDQNLMYYDLEDVLTLALGSTHNARLSLIHI